MTQFVEYMSSQPLPVGLLTIGIILASGIVFDSFFGLRIRPELRTGAALTGIVLVVVALFLLTTEPSVEPEEKVDSVVEVPQEPQNPPEAPAPAPEPSSRSETREFRGADERTELKADMQ